MALMKIGQRYIDSAYKTLALSVLDRTVATRYQLTALRASALLTLTVFRMSCSPLSPVGRIGRSAFSTQGC